MGESERRGKEAGELKASRQKETFINGEDSVTVLVWGFYSQTPFTKLPKTTNLNIITRRK